MSSAVLMLSVCGTASADPSDAGWGDRTGTNASASGNTVTVGASDSGSKPGSGGSGGKTGGSTGGAAAAAEEERIKACAWMADWSDCFKRPVTPAPTTPQVAPETLVRNALAQLNLPAQPAIVSPDPANNEWNMLAVGFPIWLTVPDTGGLTTILTQDGITISITAARAKTVFEMGDGNKVTCTRYSQRPANLRPANTPSPTCGYTYQKMGNYFLATHTYWSIAYTIDGMPGTLSHITHDTTTEPLPIGELAALVVR